MRTVDHHRAYAGVYFALNIGKLFMVIEVDRQRLVVGFCQIGGNGNNIADPGVAKGPWCTRYNQRAPRSLRAAPY